MLFIKLNRIETISNIQIFIRTICEGFRIIIRLKFSVRLIYAIIRTVRLIFIRLKWLIYF